MATTRSIRTLLATLIVALAFVAMTTEPARAATGLNSTQIQSIVGLLQAFNVPSATITQVKTILQGGSNSGSQVSSATIDANSLSTGAGKFNITGTAANTSKLAVFIAVPEYELSGSITNYAFLEGQMGKDGLFLEKPSVKNGRWSAQFAINVPSTYNVVVFDYASKVVLTQGTLTVGGDLGSDTSSSNTSANLSYSMAIMAGSEGDSFLESVGMLSGFRISVKNNGASTATLNFPTSCQVYYEIYNKSTNKKVYSSKDKQLCAQSASTLVLAPSYQNNYVVDHDNANYHLYPGTYTMKAYVIGYGSASIWFKVVPLISGEQSNTTQDSSGNISIATPYMYASATTPNFGTVPLTVAFTGTNLPCGSLTMDHGDGQTSSVTATCSSGSSASGVTSLGSHTYTAAGSYTVKLKKGSTTVAQSSVKAQAPTAAAGPAMTVSNVSINWYNGPHWTSNESALYGSFTVANASYGFVRFALVGSDNTVYTRSDDDPTKSQTALSKAISAHNGTQTFEWNLPGRTCTNGVCSFNTAKYVPFGSYKLRVFVTDVYGKTIASSESSSFDVKDSNGPVATCYIRAVGATGKDGTYAVAWTTQNAESAKLLVEGRADVSVPLEGTAILSSVGDSTRTIGLSVVDGYGYTQKPCGTVFNEPYQVQDANSSSNPNAHQTADICTNLAGDQQTMPSGYVYTNAGCVQGSGPIVSMSSASSGVSLMTTLSFLPLSLFETMSKVTDFMAAVEMAPIKIITDALSETLFQAGLY